MRFIRVIRVQKRSVQTVATRSHVFNSVQLIENCQRMQNYVEKIITAFELHDVEGIRDCFAHGVDPNDVSRASETISRKEAKNGKAKAKEYKEAAATVRPSVPT